MISELKDKVAVVTGSSRGLGKMIALAPAGEGDGVVVAARTETGGIRPALPAGLNYIQP